MIVKKKELKNNTFKTIIAPFIPAGTGFFVEYFNPFQDFNTFIDENKQYKLEYLQYSKDEVEVDYHLDNSILYWRPIRPYEQ